MLSEEYDVVPANSNCDTQVNKSLIITTPGTQTNQGILNVNGLKNQQIENSKYDNIDNISVKPMYGGNIKNFELIFKNKKYFINSNNTHNAINDFLKFTNKIYKKDILIEIKEKKNKNYNLYVIKGNKKNIRNIVKNIY
jgi:hypothetical protein